jgi:ketosteroid isomerase-like protein
MTRRTLACVAVGGLVLLGGCATSSNRPADAAPDLDGANAAKLRFLESWTKPAGTTFTTEPLAATLDPTPGAFLSFDAMSQNDTVLNGTAEYLAVWGPTMNGFTHAKLTETKPLRAWADRDLAVTSSIVRIDGELPDGKQLDMPGHLTLVFRKIDGKWLVTHEHMSLGVKD